MSSVRGLQAATQNRKMTAGSTNRSLFILVLKKGVCKNRRKNNKEGCLKDFFRVFDNMA
jgi:hypothetical protein